MNRHSVDPVLRALRRVNLQGTFFGQTVAIRFGLSESDIEALEVLIDAGAATAGRLSELTGLTTGAVTRVIDRLEQAGYVRRVPDAADRRRVVVEVVPEKIAGVEATLARLGDAGAETLRRYSDEELAVINDFLTRMAEVTRDEATALRGAGTEGEGAATSEHAAPIGGLTRARLLFRAGANELTVRGSDRFPDLYRARFDGPVPQVRLRDGTVTVQYKGFGKPWDWRKRNADVALNRSLPWAVHVHGGANKLNGDLSTVDLQAFELNGGVDTLRLTVGQPGGTVPIRVIGGVNKLRIERPTGVAVRLELTGGAGGIELDRQRLGATAGPTTLESTDAAGATALYAIEVNGGADRIHIGERS